MGDLSPHFSTDELACQHCSELGHTERLLEAMEQYRVIIGLPVHPTSVYRCPLHPLTIKRPGSQHALGDAVDFWVQGLSFNEMYLAALEVEAFKNGGIGIYPERGIIHCDVRLDGPARWGWRRDRGYTTLSDAWLLV